MPEYYIGMDVHKRTISFCVKRADGYHGRPRFKWTH
jgi:hypothetical protein